MNTPKLFQFWNGATVDLNEVFFISRVYTNIYHPQTQFLVRIYFRFDTQTQYEFSLSESSDDLNAKDTALEQFRMLIDRWSLAQ